MRSAPVYATDFRNVQAGSYITFGSYEQDNNTSNGREPIEWLVLAVENDRALLISRYGLDCKKYNENNISVTWETCDLRRWLNSDFLNSAFSDEERRIIITSQVGNLNNPRYRTRGGNTTSDKIFLLSIDEANRYFSSDDGRKMTATAYAKAQGAHVSGNGYSWWWLRSPGFDTAHAANVLDGGSVGSGGSFVDFDSRTVRPAMWVQL